MNHIHVWILLPILLVAGCTDDLPIPPDFLDAGGYTLSARYTHIRSYPGGGGIFTVYIEPEADFAGTVRLSLLGEQGAICTLNRKVLDRTCRVAELRLSPDAGMPVENFTIQVKAEHAYSSKVLPLNVTMYDWSHGDPDQELVLLDRYLDWVRANHPELGAIPMESHRRYLTYPEHLIVEHWTFLTPTWELRLCRHVMIPPHDWSMVLLRRFGSLEPVLAARLDNSASEIHEISVAEYPILYGY
jgi:hypothetical protein